MVDRHVCPKFGQILYCKSNALIRFPIPSSPRPQVCADALEGDSDHDGCLFIIGMDEHPPWWLEPCARRSIDSWSGTLAASMDPEANAALEATQERQRDVGVEKQSA